MRAFAGYLLIGSLGALAMALVTVAGLGFAVGARPVVGPGQVIQYVDRTHKGDRLDLHMSSVIRPQRPSEKQPAKKTPIGCEPVFSPLAVAAPANYPGRCVAELPAAHSMAS